LRVLVIPSRKGLREISTRDSRQATIVADYLNALHRYLATGESSALLSFRRTRVSGADGKKIALLTDLPTLDRLAAAGVLSFESIYARSL
jgi:hypothetical protein